MESKGFHKSLVSVALQRLILLVFQFTGGSESSPHVEEKGSTNGTGGLTGNTKGSVGINYDSRVVRKFLCRLWCYKGNIVERHQETVGFDFSSSNRPVYSRRYEVGKG